MKDDRFPKIEILRWTVLQALADDWESPEQIANHFRERAHINISPEELFKLIKELFESEFIFLTMNTLFDGEAVMKELKGETEDRPFWFGRTDIGYLAWEHHFDRFFRDPDDQKNTEQGAAANP